MKHKQLTLWILAGMVAGTVIGWLWPDIGISLQFLATIFVHLLLMIVAPLVFSALVVAMAGGGPLRAVGSVVWQTLLFAFIFTALILGTGLLLGYWFQPGAGISLADGTQVPATAEIPEPVWKRLVPTSIISAMTRNDVIQIVMFSVLFGLAVNLAGDKGKPVLNFCKSLLEVCFKLTHIVMYVAPIGVAGAIAAVVGEHGIGVGESFARLIAATFLGLGFIVIIIIPVLIRYAGVSFNSFIKASREPVIIAFSTSSANAAWPVALENLTKIGIPRTTASFALFTGPFNLAGSALYIGIAGLFLLQATGTSLADIGFLSFYFTLFVAGKSVFGPRGSILALAAALGSSGMDPTLVAAGFALLVGIDPLLDMPRTAVNILGTMTTACLVTRWQGIKTP